MCESYSTVNMYELCSVYIIYIYRCSFFLQEKVSFFWSRLYLLGEQYTMSSPRKLTGCSLTQILLAQDSPVFTPQNEASPKSANPKAGGSSGGCGFGFAATPDGSRESRISMTSYSRSVCEGGSTWGIPFKKKHENT